MLNMKMTAEEKKEFMKLLNFFSYHITFRLIHYRVQNLLTKNLIYFIGTINYLRLTLRWLAHAS